MVPGPGRDLRLEVVQNPDGSSVLHVQVLPFHTQLATTNAEWYDDFTFAIDVLTSEVAIDALQLGDAPYDPGDVVPAMCWLSKSGTAQDVILRLRSAAEHGRRHRRPPASALPARRPRPGRG